MIDPAARHIAKEGESGRRPEPRSPDEAPHCNTRERRVWPRRDISLPGRWHADGRWVLVSVETLSPGGATLSALVALDSDSEGWLTLDRLDLDIPCDVRWTRASTAGVRFHLDARQRTILEAHMNRCRDQSGLALPPRLASLASGAGAGAGAGAVETGNP